MAIDEEDEVAGIPEWVVTFGDMMSLLLTFFIMLVSISEIKQQEKFQAMVESLRRQFGHDASRLSMVPGHHRPRNSNMAKLATQGRAKRLDVMKGGDKVRAPVGDYPRVRTLRQDEEPAVGGVIFFEEGSAELSGGESDTIKIIVSQIAGKAQKIEIRGHTTLRPLDEDSPFRGHWDLAYARCRATMERLVELGIDPQRVRLAPAGANEPVYFGDDALLLSKNARVEIFLLSELVQPRRGVAAQQSDDVPTAATDAPTP